MYNAILYIAVAYICVSLIMVTITRYIFINILQTEQVSAVIFAMGKYELSCDTKSEKKMKNRTGLL